MGRLGFALVVCDCLRQFPLRGVDKELCPMSSFILLLPGNRASVVDFRMSHDVSTCSGVLVCQFSISQAPRVRCMLRVFVDVERLCGTILGCPG